MKKLVLLLFAILIASVGFGQSVKTLKNSVNQYLDVNKSQTYWSKTGGSTEIITQADTLWGYTIGVDNLYDELKQYFQITLTENSGTAAVDVKLQGKILWDDAWTDLLSDTYTGVGTDSTLIFDGSTAKHYRFYKVLLDGDGTGTFNVTMTKAELKFYK